MLIGWLLPQEEKTDINKINDIKNTNMLGRKNLIDINSLSGINLNYTPQFLDKNQLYSNHNWYVIEYIENFTLEDLNTQTNTLRLATPNYQREIEQNHLQNNLKTLKLTKTYSIYYITKSDSLITILENYNKVPENLLFGPLQTLSECNKLILEWANYNNISIEKINELEYTIL